MDSGLEKLSHYGLVPGAFILPICRSWSGTALSSINIEDSANAPCICDGFSPPSKFWQNPGSMEATNRFVDAGKLYDNEKYGRLCAKRHKCKKQGTWRERLKLKEDEEVVVQNAWSRCEKTFGHDDVGVQIE
ncbi:hypothetical protein EK21DRAFT_114468 [Setomelanomma holmii]|uniref:Uncharacterized protein n=1 Tax=Setomelanomma holmii TaxID=210430 RepID=A0A9P4H427_9PLEO|nr:hypothetical protein EK21DRAFT_114468 [Setomelanomma holmii]